MFTVQVNWENWCSLESPGSLGLGHGEEAIFNHLNHQPSPALFKLLIAALVTCYAIGSYAACQLKCDIGCG